MTSFLTHANSRPFQPSNCKVLLNEDSLFLEESVGTTRSNTPDSSLLERLSSDNSSDKESSGESMSPQQKVSPAHSYTSIANDYNEATFEIE